jgi:hypothetical protein
MSLALIMHPDFFFLSAVRRTHSSLAARTRGLGEHIAADRTFAHAARELLMHAYHTDAGIGGADLARLARVVRALALPGVPLDRHALAAPARGRRRHVIRRVCPRRRRRSRVTCPTALAETCAELCELRVPATQVAQAPLRALARLRRLGSLQILCMLNVDNVDMY